MLLDLNKMGIRKEVCLEYEKTTTLPHACYTLSKDEKGALLQWLQNVKVLLKDEKMALFQRLQNVKVPDVSSANSSWRVNER